MIFRLLIWGLITNPYEAMITVTEASIAAKPTRYLDIVSDDYLPVAGTWVGGDAFKDDLAWYSLTKG